MTKLYLVRHGETFDNARQILQGQMQGELNANGISQACEVRDQLASIPFDAIVASDLQRSIHTATIIAEPHHLPVATTPLLRERDWGDFTGSFIPDIQHVTWPTNVETIEALQERARHFLHFILTSYPDQLVLAVGHGIINKAIQSVLYSKPMNEITKMNNAEVRILDLYLISQQTYDR